mmetsp:Transcript_53478/g.148227  ORF Transcript_53478/g.148227 Transcript_53478/m.148227 type:complete len:332 (+) Transcript_53478:1346-2341(+)
MRKSRSMRNSLTEVPAFCGLSLSRLEMVKTQSSPTTGRSTRNQVLKYRHTILSGTMIVMPSSVYPVSTDTTMFIVQKISETHSMMLSKSVSGGLNTRNVIANRSCTINKAPTKSHTNFCGLPGYIMMRRAQPSFPAAGGISSCSNDSFVLYLSIMGWLCEALFERPHADTSSAHTGSNTSSSLRKSMEQTRFGEEALAAAASSELATRPLGQELCNCEPTAANVSVPVCVEKRGPAAPAELAPNSRISLETLATSSFVRWLILRSHSSAQSLRSCCCCCPNAANTASGNIWLGATLAGGELLHCRRQGPRASSLALARGDGRGCDRWAHTT